MAQVWSLTFLRRGAIYVRYCCQQEYILLIANRAWSGVRLAATGSMSDALGLCVVIAPVVEAGRVAVCQRGRACNVSTALK
jgi:hypothetical protein